MLGISPCRSWQIRYARTVKKRLAMGSSRWSENWLSSGDPEETRSRTYTATSLQLSTQVTRNASSIQGTSNGAGSVGLRLTGSPIAGGLGLGPRVELGAEQHGDRGNPQPQHEYGDAGQTSVRLPVVCEVVDEQRHRD
jgi:hypothetical protein